MESVVVRDPAIMSGEPTFRGTRVLVRTLFDYLEAGHSMERFLLGFPTVTREMALKAWRKRKNRCSRAIECASSWMNASMRAAPLLPWSRLQTCRYAGLKGLANGRLLAAAEQAGFEAMITVDQNMPHQ